jgi:hypothetical protein
MFRSGARSEDSLDDELAQARRAGGVAGNVEIVELELKALIELGGGDRVAIDECDDRRGGCCRGRQRGNRG